MSFSHDNLGLRVHRFGVMAFGYGLWLTVHTNWVQLTWGAVS